MIYVCSQYRGDIEANTAFARKACKFVLTRLGGEAAFAPHLLYTQMLDDSIEEERNIGIRAGLEVMLLCDAVYVFQTVKDGVYSPISNGMQKEIEFAQENGIEIVRWYSEDSGNTFIQWE